MFTYSFTTILICERTISVHIKFLKHQTIFNGQSAVSSIVKIRQNNWKYIDKVLCKYKTSLFNLLTKPFRMRHENRFYLASVMIYKIGKNKEFIVFSYTYFNLFIEYHNFFILISASIFLFMLFFNYIT